MAAINQVAAVHAQEVLHVERIGRGHEPGAVSQVAKHLPGDKFFWIGAEEKRQGEQCLGAVEEKDRAVALGDRIRS